VSGITPRGALCFWGNRLFLEDSALHTLENIALPDRSWIVSFSQPVVKD
jgi:hypothetical protein